MAQCYMKGIGTSKDEGIAYPMYIKAAEEGRSGSAGNTDLHCRSGTVAVYRSFDCHSRHSGRSGRLCDFCSGKEKGR